MIVLMSGKTISETLKRLLFEHDLKVIDLARLTDIPQPTVQRLVAGTSSRPHEKSLVPIAKYFNISLEQLRGERPIPNPNQTEATLKELGVKRVPLLSWDQVASWLNDISTNKHSTPLVLTDSLTSTNSFALTVKDASMEPLFPIGTTVIFNPEKEPQDRYYVLVSLKNYEEPVFRQLLLDASDKFIKPLSPDLERFRMHLLNKDDKIIGTLVEAKQHYAD